MTGEGFSIFVWVRKAGNRNMPDEIDKTNTLDSNKIVSVIIPMFNVRPYLVEALDSVLQQTFIKIWRSSLLMTVLRTARGCYAMSMQKGIAVFV